MTSLLLLASVLLPASATGATWTAGDVVVGSRHEEFNFHEHELFDNSGAFKETLGEMTGSELTGCAFDSNGDFYGTHFQDAKVVKLSRAHPHNELQTIDLAAEGADGTESIDFAADGSFYVGNADGDANVYHYDAAGNLLDEFDVAVDDRGSDWIDLSSDQRTLFYTSEGRQIKRYDVVEDSQLTDFATLPENPNPPDGEQLPPPSTAFALRLLPPGDGTGGLLVAQTRNIKRVDATGNVIQTYDAVDENGVDEDGWFALSLDPNGTSFWAGIDRWIVTTRRGSVQHVGRNIYRFNIATGVVEAGPIPVGVLIGGICVVQPLAVRADLAVEKLDEPDPVLNGEELRYAVTVSNDGPDPAEDAVVTDELPPEVELVSSPPECSSVDNELHCTIGDLAVGDSRTLEIVVRPTDVGEISNTARVESTTDDPDLNNNVATEPTQVLPAADLQVTKTDDPDPVRVGERLTYRLTVTNNGPDDAESVIVTDELPANVEFRSASRECTRSGRTVTCQLGAMAAGESRELEIVVKTTERGNLSNTAAVEGEAMAPPGPFKSPSRREGNVALGGPAPSSEDDPDLSNNAATEPTQVIDSDTDGDDERDGDDDDQPRVEDERRDFRSPDDGPLGLPFTGYLLAPLLLVGVGLISGGLLAWRRRAE